MEREGGNGLRSRYGVKLRGGCEEEEGTAERKILEFIGVVSLRGQLLQLLLWLGSSLTFPLNP